MCTLGAARPAQAAFPTGPIGTVMSWLPDDIESITCARGPLTIAAAPRKKSEADQPVRQPLGVSSQFYNSNVWLRVAEKRLAGRTITYSLEAKRKFRAPKDLGMEKYEGCGVLLLQSQPGITQLQVDTALQEHAKKKLDVQGVAVALISNAETRNNRDTWSVYLAAPDPDTVLIATDLTVLEHVIGQIKAKVDATSPAFMRPLSPQWQGWSFVDTASRLWMVRHDISHAAEGQEPNDIVGYEDVANDSILLTGIMSDKVELFNAISNIRTETHLRLVTKEVGPGTYEIRCWLRGDAEELGTLAYYLTNIFGPAIIVAPF